MMRDYTRKKNMDRPIADLQIFVARDDEIGYNELLASDTVTCFEPPKRSVVQNGSIHGKIWFCSTKFLRRPASLKSMRSSTSK